MTIENKTLIIDYSKITDEDAEEILELTSIRVSRNPITGESTSLDRVIDYHNTLHETRKLLEITIAELNK